MNESDPDVTLPPGATVAGRYRVTDVLGKGGMGVVYRAEHIELGRRIALKVLLPRYATNGEVVSRFLREARAAASIGHPGIVEVFDLGHSDGAPFLAMELLEGEELFARIVREHPLEVEVVRQVGVEIAEALGAAHARGIVHRDMKPQNVFLARRGRKDVVKVLDFGIAKLLEGDRADAPLTRTGQIIGTPLYMAPEQLANTKDLDARTDVYAIGAILYEALAGKPPFVAETYPELVLKISSQKPVPIARLRPDAPASLVAIVERAMHKDRAERFATGAELASALDDFSSGVRTAQSEPVGRSGTSAPLRGPEGRPSVRPRAIEPRGGAAALLETAPSDPDHSASAPTPVGAAASTVTPFSTSSLRPGSATARWPRAARWGGALVVAVLGGALVWSFAVGTGTHETTASPAPAAAEEEPSAIAPTEVVPRGVDPPPPEPRAPATHTVHIESLPRSGAEISSGAGVLCTTPCAVELGDEPMHLVAKLRGFRTSERAIDAPIPERIVFELEPRRPREAGTPAEETPSMEEEPPPLLPR